jgi:hypothetical protein
MDDDNKPVRGLFWLLTPEGKTLEPEPQPESSNVVYLDDYRKRQE